MVRVVFDGVKLHHKSVNGKIHTDKLKVMQEFDNLIDLRKQLFKWATVAMIYYEGTVYNPNTGKIIAKIEGDKWIFKKNGTWEWQYINRDGSLHPSVYLVKDYKKYDEWETH